MPVIETTSRSALVSAVGSAATTVARGNHTTTWHYRDGYVSTTDPGIAGFIAVGVACLGLAALVEALADQSPSRTRNRRTLR